MIALETGSGPKAWSLYDLWIANGKPTQIIVAAYGPATCKIDGFRWTAGTGYACAAGAISLKEVDGKLIGQPAGVVMPLAAFAYDPTLLRVSEASVGALITTYGIEWWNAGKWAKNGYYVRRKEWTDTSQKIRFEEGTGTAKAVAILQSNTIAKRVVRNSDFGVIEFNAIDWIVLDAPSQIDLTDSILYANGQWMLTHSGGTVTTGGGTGTGTGGTTGGGTTGGTTDEEPTVINGIVVESFDLDTVCQLTMTRVQLDIARGIATAMAVYGNTDAWSDDMKKYFQVSVLTGGIEQMVNANAAAGVKCAGYYERYILSLFNLEADGSSTTQGEPGTPGSIWYNGTTSPSSGIGVDGDYYLQAPVPGANVAVYNKQAGTWVNIFIV